jgi:RND family efflux transporter MFP subunit
MQHSRALIGLILLSTVAACGRGGQAPAEPRESLSVTVGQAQSRPLRLDIVASGSITPWQETSLGVELAGLRVTQVFVDVGSKVRAGQTLLQLDTRSLQVDLRRAEAALAQARANRDLAAASAARGETLRQQQLISQSNLDELRAGSASAEAALLGAIAERDAARLRLTYASLRAPDAGVISARAVQPGQIVASGTELLRLIRRGRLELRAELSASDIARVRPGSEVRIRAPDGSDVVGVVRLVAPALDAGLRTGLIYVDLPQPGSLRAGMFAEGRIALGEAPAEVLPREAVVVRDGYSYVFVVDAKSRVVQRRITAGPPSGDFVPVRAGLQKGERVVIKGAGFLSDGDLVRVVTADGGAPQP